MGHRPPHGTRPAGPPMLTRVPARYRKRIQHTNQTRKGPERNHMDQPEEPEPYRHMSRADLIALIQSLTIESANHRRGKRFWKKRCAELENKLDNL